jgi:hypothetical protein
LDCPDGVTVVDHICPLKCARPKTISTGGSSCLLSVITLATFIKSPLIDTGLLQVPPTWVVDHSCVSKVLSANEATPSAEPECHLAMAGPEA